MYRIAKSKISGYDGAQILFDFPFSEPSNYEEGGEKTGGSVDKAMNNVSNIITKATDKVADTIIGTVNKAKEEVEDRGDNRH